jgi:hypothetical protein
MPIFLLGHHTMASKSTGGGSGRAGRGGGIAAIDFDGKSESEIESFGMALSQSWAESLSPEQKASILTYTGGAYSEINELLRNNPDAGFKWQDIVVLTQANGGNYMQHVAGIDAALAKASLSRSVITYRGFKNTSGRIYEVGGELMDPAVQSTSLSRSTAEGFASISSRSVIMRVHVKKGAQAAYANASGSYYESERELILNRRSRYRIKAISQDSDGRTVLDVDHYDPDKSIT